MPFCGSHTDHKFLLPHSFWQSCEQRRNASYKFNLGETSCLDTQVISLYPSHFSAHSNVGQCFYANNIKYNKRTLGSHYVWSRENTDATEEGQRKVKNRLLK